MHRAGSDHRIRCSFCSATRRVAVYQFKAYFQSLGDYRTIYRLCWKHAESVKILLAAMAMHQP